MYSRRKVVQPAGAGGHPLQWWGKGKVTAASCFCWTATLLIYGVFAEPKTSLVVPPLPHLTWLVTRGARCPVDGRTGSEEDPIGRSRPSRPCEGYEAAAGIDNGQQPSPWLLVHAFPHVGLCVRRTGASHSLLMMCRRRKRLCRPRVVAVARRSCHWWRGRQCSAWWMASRYVCTRSQYTSQLAPPPPRPHALLTSQSRARALTCLLVVATCRS